mmetsp:Transcript_52044/g.123922  ORF Transcript_52044/g.123922 Transcript_52044/m.123922 type:complete len:208 (-) Transcript_52044:123-746(-)
MFCVSASVVSRDFPKLSLNLSSIPTSQGGNTLSTTPCKLTPTLSKLRSPKVDSLTTGSAGELWFADFSTGLGIAGTVSFSGSFSLALAAPSVEAASLFRSSLFSDSRALQRAALSVILLFSSWLSDETLPFFATSSVSEDTLACKALLSAVSLFNWALSSVKLETLDFNSRLSASKAAHRCASSSAFANFTLNASASVDSELNLAAS